MTEKKIFYFDCDGVICDTKDTDYENAIPKQENINHINALYDKGHCVVVFTGRGSVSDIDWRDLTERQLKAWGVKYHELIFGKPNYDVFIDDKAWNVRNFEEGLCPNCL